MHNKNLSSEFQKRKVHGGSLRELIAFLIVLLALILALTGG